MFFPFYVLFVIVERLLEGNSDSKISRRFAIFPTGFWASELMSTLMFREIYQTK